MSDLAKVCERAARVGGDVLQSWRSRFRVSEKGPADLVTEADLASQEAIRALVLGEYPHHDFLGEEDAQQTLQAPAVASSSGYRWIVDPLDGTTNYVHGFPQYSVSVAVERAGQVEAGCVFDPCAGECFTASLGGGAFLNGVPIRVSGCSRLDQALVAVSLPPQVRANSPEIDRLIATMLAAQSIRRLGSSALNLCYVAVGRLDAYWATAVKVWDVAAGLLIVREAGGTLLGLDGGEVSLEQPRLIAAGASDLAQSLRATLAACQR